MGDIRWGIIGTGGIAHLQTADLISHGFTVSAVGSRTAEAADAFAAEFGIASAHASYQALVDDPTVDVVYVSTPNPFHVGDALLALEAGKHVLLEKPFTLNATEARQVVDAAQSRGLAVLEAMWTRFLPHMDRIHQVIAAGTIGEVRTLLADHNQLLPADPHHRINNPELGGGALLDLGIYPISFAFDLFGPPTEVLATAAKTATGVDRQTAIILSYSGGRQAVLHTALDAQGPNRATIVGTAGRIELDPVWYTPTPITVYDSDGTVLQVFDEPVTGRGMQYQAAELERLISTGRIGGSRMAPAESVQIMETLDEVRRQIGLIYPGER